MRKNFLSIMIAVFSVIILLSACGKVSPPVPMEGSEYPHSYPKR